MSEFKGTPGAWGLSENGFGVYGPAPDEWGIAHVTLYGRGGGGLSDDEQRANARLIAAAPELLRAAVALSHLVRSLTACPGATPELVAEVLNFADAAVARAKGG